MLPEATALLCFSWRLITGCHKVSLEIRKVCELDVACFLLAPILCHWLALLLAPAQQLSLMTEPFHVYSLIIAHGHDMVRHSFKWGGIPPSQYTHTCRHDDHYHYVACKWTTVHDSKCPIDPMQSNGYWWKRSCQLPVLSLSLCALPNQHPSKTRDTNRFITSIPSTCQHQTEWMEKSIDFSALFVRTDSISPIERHANA